MNQEVLPFQVRRVCDPDEMHKAVQIRHAAYTRHLPELAATLLHPEAADDRQGVVVLLAESKLDGTPLGSLRVQTNEFHPLPLEASIELPPELTTLRLAEATRLGITADKVGHLVKTALFKAFFLHCQNEAVDWMVIAGRSPLDRMYQRLLFDDVYPGLGYVPLRHASKNWADAGHALFPFVFETDHPDIQLSQRRRNSVTPKTQPLEPRTFNQDTNIRVKAAISTKSHSGSLV
jgi:hypothetical protein